MTQASLTNSMGEALQNAVDRLRQRLGDHTAPVVVVVPAGPNSVLARTALALRTSFMRVWFDTPEGLAQAQAPLSLWSEGRLEPAGWRRPVVRRIVQGLATDGRLGDAGPVLQRRGWLEPLLQALARLEGHGITVDDLRQVSSQPGAGASDRAALLGTLLEALQQARAAEGVLAAEAVAVAARAAVDAGIPGTGAALARGVVVLGDRELPRTVSDFFVRWLQARSAGAVVVVRPPATRWLEPAPLGLRAAVRAAGHAIDDTTKNDVIDVAAAAVADLGRLHGGLFAPSSSSSSPSPSPSSTSTSWPAGVAPPDGSVELARTPDDVRECSECVREVRRAIARGVTLDQIAVVLPDSRQRGALEDALDRARIPATWLIGHPAAELPPARLLALALDIAGEPAGDDDNASHDGDQTPERLYELLQHPALALRAALGPDAVAGRGRWRRLLGKAPRARGLDVILAALTTITVDGAPSAPSVDTGDSAAREAVALRGLIHTVTTLRGVLLEFEQPAPLAEHARRWFAFIERFARSSEPRGRLLKLLQPLALAARSSTTQPVGPAIGLGEARQELERLLEREVSRGSLTERSIRVLAPLHLVGGSFETVCVLGLSEGRFPTAAHEDVLVPDALWSALSSRVGVLLPGAAAHDALERRRYAAAVGAARSRLWLSVPRLDFATERPSLPSGLAVSTVSTLTGRRASYAEVDRVLVVRGRRAFSWPEHEAGAIDRAEHLLSRSAQRSPSALRALSAHPFSRGLLTLQRSMARVARDGTLDAWTGLVSTTLLPMPGLDGTPVPISLLERLMTSAGDVLFGSLLRASLPRRLQAFGDPLATAQLIRQLVEVARTTVSAGDPAPVVREAVVAGLQALADCRGLDADDVALALPIVGREAKDLAAAARAWCQTPPPLSASVDPATAIQIDDGLPWRVTGVVGRVLPWADGTALVALEESFRPQAWVKDNPLVALSALALVTSGVPLDGVAAMSPTATSSLVSMDKVEAQRTLLQRATLQAQQGQWPVWTSKTYALAMERRAARRSDDVDDTTGETQ